MSDQESTVTFTAPDPLLRTPWGQQSEALVLTEASLPLFPADMFSLTEISDFSVFPPSVSRSEWGSEQQIPPCALSAQTAAATRNTREDSSYSYSNSSGRGGCPGNGKLDVERGLESIMDGIFEMGFDSLEEMVIAYYTRDFDESSTIGQAQRLSRKRHVRALISAMNDSARSWTEDEASPLQEEVLKSAEVLYAAEVQHLRSFQNPEFMREPTKLLEDFLAGRSDSSIEAVVYRDLRCDVSDPISVNNITAYGLDAWLNRFAN